MSFTKLMTRKLTNYDNQNSIGVKLRIKRITPLLKMIESVFNEHGCVNIVDIGGTEKYWNIVHREFLEEFRVKITIINLPGRSLPDNYGPFTFIHGDGCEMSAFDTNSFDIAHSNSVIEHIGDWSKMVVFSNELKRVAKKYFIQTPNYWFPIEPHCMTPFFHWLPKPIRIWLVMHFSLGHWRKANSIDEAVRIIESARLLNKKMLHELFDDAVINTEKLFLLSKSYLCIRE
ncbi:MAG: methyltransferase domain-containing protein [Candidatus Thiodiazotropha sp.]